MYAQGTQYGIYVCLRQRDEAERGLFTMQEQRSEPA